MNIGELNQRIEIQTQASTKNEYGETIGSWTTIANVWAGIKPVGGQAFYAARAIHSLVPVNIIMRYGQNVDLSHRIKAGDKIYRIEAVQEHPKRGIIIIKAREE